MFPLPTECFCKVCGVLPQDQYIFIHDALLEYIQSGGDTEVKDSNISKYVEDLLQEDSDKVTFLEKQFKVGCITQWRGRLEVVGHMALLERFSGIPTSATVFYMKSC